MGPVIAPGSRVTAGKEKMVATVRYVGPVDGQEGLWAGLEWDDASRGKHDGTVEGRQYFECRAPGTPASLVRLEKVYSGRSFVEALRERYLTKNGKQEQMYVNTTSDRLVAVELCGQEKLASGRSLERLHVASLRSEGISVAGSDEDLDGVSPCTEELDLSSNLLTAWEEVARMAAALPKLRVLNLTSNILGPANALPALLPALSVLVLNATKVQWAQVTLLEASLPGLSELHLNSNSISTLRSDSWEPEKAFKSLTILSLDGNLLSDWSEVAALGALPALQRLHLSVNTLSQISGRPAAGHWSQLRALMLGNNCICSWASVDALEGFPCLSELRISGNPVLDLSRQGGRYEVIARLPRLELLNGSAVKLRERQDAELRYLRIVWAELEEPGAEKAVVEAANPQLPALLDKYGPMSTGAADLREMTTMAAQMVQINLTCVAVKSVKNMGTKTKKLPGSMSISQLKMLCESLFKVKTASQALFLRVPGEPMPENIGEDDTQTLDFFSVQDGWEVLVDEASP